MTKRFHDIEEHHPLQPIPWNAEEEEALFCEESLQLLWKMELGVSMTNNNISSGIQNKPKNILSNEDDCPKAVKNASPTFSVFNSFNCYDESCGCRFYRLDKTNHRFYRIDFSINRTLEHRFCRIDRLN